MSIILAMNPLSHTFNNCGKGFDIKNNNGVLYKISHLFYIDDLKYIFFNIFIYLETFSNGMMFG